MLFLRAYGPHPQPNRWIWLICIVASCWALPSATAHGNDAHVEIIDADTLRVNGEEVRLYGIDAPETAGARCERERHLGERAAGFVAGALTFGQFAMKRVGRDAAGRTLARAFVNGNELANALLAAGLARPSEGERADWCGQETPGQTL